MLEGIRIIKPNIFSDDRGYFFESYQKTRFSDSGISDDFLQDNEAASHRGVLRGLHYQVAPHEQSKLVRVVLGAVFDAVVDIRPHSQTYGDWFGIELSAENKTQLFIPPGFAHGYLALEDNTILCYKCGAYYAQGCEGGIRFDDPKVGIDWPELDCDIIISEKDLVLPAFGAHLSA